LAISCGKKEFRIDITVVHQGHQIKATVVVFSTCRISKFVSQVCKRYGLPASDVVVVLNDSVSHLIDNVATQTVGELGITSDVAVKLIIDEPDAGGVAGGAAGVAAGGAVGGAAQ